MARNIHWQIPFKDIDNDLCYVNIYEEGYTGSVVTLVGATVPFETQENDDEDWTLPIRTSTGYIRIVTDSSTLLNDIIPSSPLERYVELVTGGSASWCGYVQQQSIDGILYAGNTEVEIPIQSYLATQLNEYLSTSFEGYQTIGEFIQGLCGTDIENVYFTKNELFIPTTVTDISGHSEQTPTPLRISFNREMFKEQIDMIEYYAHQDIYTGKYEPQQKSAILEAICQLFGWIVYEDGKNYYFKAIAEPSTTPYLCYTRSQLSQKSPTPTEETSIVETSLTYLSTDHHSIHTLPYKKFSFKDAEAEDEYVAFEGKFEDFATDNLPVVSSSYRLSDGMFLNCYSLASSLVLYCYRYNRATGQPLDVNQNSILNLDKNGSTNNYYGGEYGLYRKEAYFGSGDNFPETVEHEGFLIKKYNDTESKLAARIDTHDTIWGYVGITNSSSTYFHLSITADILVGQNFDDLKEWDDERYIEIAVGINGKFYSSANDIFPTSDTPVKLKVYYKKGKISWGRWLTSNGMRDLLFRGVLYGNVSLLIYTPTNTGFNYTLLKNLKISVEYSDNRGSLDSYGLFNGYGNHIKNVDLIKNLNTNGHENFDIETPFSGDLSNASLMTPDSYYSGMIMKYIGSYTSKGGIEGLAYRLYNKLAQKLSKSHEVLTLIVSEYPDPQSYISIGGKQYHILSRARNWRDTQTTLKLIEL